jgi:hypothetical protein
MKRIAILVLFLSFAVVAEDLEIMDAQLGCIDQKKDAVNDPFKYRYGVELIIQNNGENPITLLTKINSLASIPVGDSDNFKTQRVLSYNTTKRGDFVIIPPKDQLELVELFPGDQTIISYQFSYKDLIKESNFEYYSKVVYGGRFNNWVGRLHTKELTTQILYKCKT